MPGSLWNRLALATPQPDPFCALTAWQLSFREALEPQRQMLVRQCDDGLVQFGLQRTANRSVLAPIERLWLFGCNVLGPSGPDLLEQMVRDDPTGASGTRRGIVVAGTDPAGPLMGALTTRLARGLDFSMVRQEVQCSASLEGGMDGYLSRRSANLRRNLRRASKRASELGFLFERHQPASAEDADAVYRRMLAVERRSWKGLMGEGMGDTSFTLRFYGAMLRRLSVSRDGVDIGYIFGGMAGGIYRGQQFSFDDAYRAQSVGNLLQEAQIEWLCEQGAERYDMGPLLGPHMDYKHSWTELRHPIEAWLIQPA